MWEKPIRNDWHIKMADSVIARDTKPHAKWEYDDGVVMQGMAMVYALTGEPKYLAYVKNLMDTFVEGDGATIRGYRQGEYNIDHINNGKVLLYLYAETGEPKYRRAAELLMEQLKAHPRTSEGGFWHKQIYPFQMWLDGIYMEAPFYARYGTEFLGGETLTDVGRQIRLCYAHTLDEKTGLLYHAWDEKHAQPWCDPKTGCSHHFWGRSLGWFCAALVDVLDYVPGDHPLRTEIAGMLSSCCQAVMAVQDPASGAFYQVMDQGTRPGNYLESSASCLLLYAFAKGVRLSYLPASLAPRLATLYRGIITQFVEVYKGLVNLNKCCQVGGLGNVGDRDGSFAYYMSEPIVCNDRKGVGGFLQAAAEMEGHPGLYGL